MGKLKVIHFVQDISNKSGGLKSAIFNLSLGIKKKRIHPIIYTFSNVNELDDYLVNNISIRCIGDLFIFDIKRIIKFVKDFYEDFIRDDLGIIHIHGLWTFTPFLGFVVAKLFKRKYILSPHGMLMPNALSKNKFKKKWAILLYQKRIINESKVIISSSDIETSAVKNFDKKLTVKKIPHGIEFPKFIKHIELNGCKTAVFLGRYNESKGIEQLLEIWCELNLSNWNLKIAGILEDINYFNKLKKGSKK